MKNFYFITQNATLKINYSCNFLVCIWSQTLTQITSFGRNIYVCVKLATFVKGDPNAPFSIATTPRCRGECYSIPWIAPVYLSVKQGGIKYHFLSLWYDSTWDWTLGHWWTLLIKHIYIYIYIYLFLPPKKHFWCANKFNFSVNLRYLIAN